MTDIAPDGSPLAFYRRLPPDGEPEMIHDLIPAGATILELMRAAVTDGIVDAEVRYGVDDHEWRQAIRACLLDRSSLEGLLGDAGLAFDRWLDRPGWFVANARR
jgi:hypothetical protein